MSKFCNACLFEFPLNNFHKAGTSYQAKCKPCYNKHIYSLEKARRAVKKEQRSTVKQNPFQKLPVEKQIIILEAMALRKHMTKISLLVDTNAHVLHRWKRLGLLKLDETLLCLNVPDEFLSKE